MENIPQRILLAEAQCCNINRVSLLFQSMYELFHHLKKLLHYVSKNLDFVRLLHVLCDLCTDELKDAWVDNIGAGEVVFTIGVLDLEKVDHGAVNTVARVSNLLDHVDN